MTRILSIIGQQGSGKSTVAKLVADQLHAQHIEASSVVREIFGDLPRSEMPKTNRHTKDDPDWLGRAIRTKIYKERVVISGIREREVHHDLMTGIGGPLLIVGLWAPQQERFARVKALGKCKDFGEFITHESSELDIGLRALLREHPPKYVTSEHVPVGEVVEMIVDGLSRGWKLSETHI